jgi:N-formylmaleamate deformylase
MPDWINGEVVANGIRMHFTRTGGDKPPLILSHGATDNGLCWTRVTRALEADYDVIMPDARGHGRSDAPATGYTTADHAADLAEFIHALGLNRPALGGHSMGAATTLHLIAAAPDIASCAILEDPPIRSTPPAAPPAGQPDPRAAIRRNVIEAQSSDIESTIRRGRAASPTWSEDELQPWAEAKMQVSRQFLDALGGGRIGQDWREQVQRARCPILLITADPERGGIVTPESAQEAATLQPNLQVVRLSGAGHNIRREQFEGFVQAVRPFLALHHSRALV